MALRVAFHMDTMQWSKDLALKDVWALDLKILLGYQPLKKEQRGHSISLPGLISTSDTAERRYPISQETTEDGRMSPQTILAMDLYTLVQSFSISNEAIAQYPTPVFHKGPK